MLFGMGIQLTEDDDAILKEVVAPAYAALGLANDYFSFDREYAEHIDQKDTDGLVQEPMTNSVWLCMGWHSLSIEDAKTIVRDETIRQEQEFAACKAAFTSSSQCTDKIRQCLDGLSQMIIGNIVWSLRCPRYHPLLRYDANAGVENQLLALSQPTFNDAQAACLRSTSTTPPLPDCTTTPGGIDSPMDASPSTPQETSTTDNTESATSEKAILSFHSALHSRAVLTDEVVRAPFEWCASAPSKQFRASLIDALNIWTGVPLVSLNIIKSIGSQLHNASLLLDDIEDRSPLRRGRPAAYTVFGVAETINSANFAILEATSQAQNLNRQSSLVFHERMQQLYIGQSYDIRWARHKTCPSLEEYTAMIDGKTGGLLHLIVGLMLSNAANPLPSCQTSKLEELITLIGRLFQIRDDYQNLNSLEYESAKGFGEDLDEGKYSYPMVVALSLESRSKRLIESILAGCEPSVGLSRAMKLVVRDEMEACGAFAATVQAINELDAEILRRIDAIEVALQEKSWALRWLIKSLGIQ
jgi:ophiobolin F synthase